MKKLLLMGLLALGEYICLWGCYDKGYHDGREDQKKEILNIIEEESEEDHENGI